MCWPPCECPLEGLELRRIQGPVRWLEEVDSTNRLARAWALEGAPEGALVVARRQTAGRGRRGRAWHSPEGGLWLSVVLRPPALEGLSLAMGLAVARTCRELGVEAEIRWPNDVWAGGRKLAGVLAEGHSTGGADDFAIAGLGINANLHSSHFPPELEGTATSLARERGQEVDLRDLLRRTVQQVDGVYARFTAGGFAPLVPELAALCPMLGRPVEVESSGDRWVGVASRIAPDGALELEDGRRLHQVERLRVL